MTAPLSSRDEQAIEWMDGPCDDARLAATYRRFTVINRAVSGWRGLYRERIRPLLAPGGAHSLLDIGFGGGDIPRAIARWAQADGLSLSVTAIDPDPRALVYASEADRRSPVRYRLAASGELVAAGEAFDIVISNHLLHHLDESARDGLLDHSDRLARRLVLHSDIERGRLAYALYALGAAPLAPGSYVHVDGLLSIRRSYTAPELRRVIPPGWAVERPRPFRLLLSREPRSSSGGR